MGVKLLRRLGILWCISAIVAAPIDEAPDTSDDQFQPYPALSEIGTRGTRLFEYGGCNIQQTITINEAFDDQNQLVSLDGTNSKIDWAHQSAIDFFGPSRGKYQLTKKAKSDIESVLNAASKVHYSISDKRKNSWLRVRCSTWDNGSEICKDREALAIPPSGTDDFSTVVFCKRFFNTSSLADAIIYGNSQQEPDERIHLHNYDNRARVFLHAITQLPHLLQLSSNVPTVGSVEVHFTQLGESETYETVRGAGLTKLLASYRSSEEKGGYYTQRNADNFAFFALARFVQSRITDYPYLPMLANTTLTSSSTRDTRPLITTLYPEASQISGIIDDPKIPICGPNCGRSQVNATISNFMQASDLTTAQIVQRRAQLANYYNFPINDLDLRILPVGDSITYGFGSTLGNGWRYRLYTNLTSNAANRVDMIGNVISGQFTDIDNEGYGGALINSISEFSTVTLPKLPNIVLLHAGTNDLNIDKDVHNAPKRLGAFIDKILSYSPAAVIFVAQIIPARSPFTNARILDYNAALPSVVASRIEQGHKVFLVDMHSRVSNLIEFKDELHPNDEGYEVMGNTWLRAIAYANAELGWITCAVDTGLENQGGLRTCKDVDGTMTGKSKSPVKAVGNGSENGHEKVKMGFVWARDVYPGVGVLWVFAAGSGVLFFLWRSIR